MEMRRATEEIAFRGLTLAFNIRSRYRAIIRTDDELVLRLPAPT